MNNRVRLHKEQADRERAIAEKKQKDKEALGDMIMNILLFIAGISVFIPLIALGLQLLQRN
jgi:hypothetical protein